jgi:hypothetical protein
MPPLSFLSFLSFLSSVTFVSIVTFATFVSFVTTSLALAAAVPAIAESQAIEAPRAPAAASVAAWVVIACPLAVAARQTFECVVTATVPATAAAAPIASGPLIVRVSLPPDVFHAAHSEGGHLDDDQRVVSWVVAAHAGEDAGIGARARQKFSLSLIVDPQAAGRSRVINAEISNGLSVESDTNAHDPAGQPAATAAAAAAVQIDRPSVTNLGIATVPARPAVVFASSLLLPPLVLLTIWILRRGRRARGRAPRRAGDPIVGQDMVMLPAVIAVASATLVLAFFPACVESIRSRTTFIPATCTVLDRGLSTNDDAPGTPIAVLRYDAGGQTRTSMGFDVLGTFLRASDQQAYRQFEIGRRYPCWYDPARPEHVILRQGPSGVAMVAFVPLLVFLGSVTMLRGAWRA